MAPGGMASMDMSVGQATTFSANYQMSTATPYNYPAFCNGTLTVRAKEWKKKPARECFPEPKKTVRAMIKSSKPLVLPLPKRIRLRHGVRQYL